MPNPYLEKIEKFYGKERRMPSYSEMMKLFGFKSKNAVFKVIEKLVEGGIVAKDHLGRLVPAQAFGEVPLLGSVTAGLPRDETEEILDRVNLDDYLIEKKTSTFLLEVDGDSMIDAHIEKGDMVLVERTNHAKDGDIVIAEVDGEFTMKYLREGKRGRYLEPANKKYSAIYPEHSLSIQGKVKAVIRKY